MPADRQPAAGSAAASDDDAAGEHAHGVANGGGRHSPESNGHSFEPWGPARARRLATLLAKEDGLGDVILRAGRPAECIPASRLLLAALSPALEQRLRSLDGCDRGADLDLPELSAAAARALVAHSCGVANAFGSCAQADVSAVKALLRRKTTSASGGDAAASASSTGAGDSSSSSSWLRSGLTALGALLVLCVALAAYLPLRSFNMEVGGFFMDDAMIRRNEVVVAPSLDWRRLFRTDYWGLEMFDPNTWTHKSFRPLAVLTFRWNYLLHGFNSAGFHLANGAMHASACVQLAYFSYRSLRLPIVWSVLLASLFAVHPVHAESICYVVGRADLLCTQALLLAAQLYGPCCASAADRCGPVQGAVRLVLAVILILVSGLCKETGFTFFGLLVVWEGLAILRLQKGRGSLQHWLRILALLVIGGAACAARMWYTSGTSIARMDPYSNPIAASEDQRTRVLSYALVHGMYVKLLIWPTFLCYDYSMDAVPLVTSLQDARLLLPCAAYLAVVQVGCLVVWHLGFRSRRHLAEVALLGLAIFALSFLPMTNILFPIGTLIAERLLYIPSLGFFVVTVALLHLASRRSPARSLLALLVALAVVAILWLLCYRRVGEWRSVEEITRVDGLKQLRSTRTQFNLANMYMMEQRLDEALVAYQRANSLDPQERDSMPLYHAGQILMYKGQYAEAEQYLQKAVAGYFSPLTLHEEEVWHDYALALWHTGRGMEAVQNFNNAIITNPQFPKGYNNLACAMVMVGLSQQPQNVQMVQQGLQVMEQALGLNPGMPLYWRNAAALLGLAGNSAASMQAWDRLRQLDPASAAAAEATGSMPKDCVWEFYFR